MRHAFLIIAHSNWWQLKKLIECLDSENHDIYVHIDKKSVDFNEKYFENCTDESSVRFYQEYKVYWGGFSVVQVELFLFEKAYDKHYDYYHVISGMDLPLKNNKEIDDFFTNNKGKEFILFDDHALNSNPEIRRRTRYYHFLQNYRRRYNNIWKNNFFTFCERVLLVIQILFRVNRVRKLDWKIKYGSNWVSITDKLVNVILDNKEKITKIFKYTNCSDELFVQTIAYNCGFINRIYCLKNGQTSNVRFIDWERGKNGNPYTFKIDDLEVLSKANDMDTNLFARKFSETVDKKVIEEILLALKSERI